MSLRESFARVNRGSPCPVCSKPDWCMIGRAATEFEGTAICKRVASPKPFGAAGSLHQLRGATPRHGALRRSLQVARASPEPAVGVLAVEARVAVSASSLRTLGDRLGVTRHSLGTLGVGEIDARLASEHNLAFALGAWTFPMRDGAGKVVGVRLRLRNGEKRSVKGGREGLFIPSGLSGAGPLLVCEGPSDTAAMLDLGFDVVGVPSAGACGAELVELVKRRGVRAVVVVGDADAVGRKGAADLATLLCAHVRDVSVVEPPSGVKDARDWKRAGATRQSVESSISHAVNLGSRAT